MTVVEGAKSAGLISRVQNILLKPAAEWDVIAGETATTQSLFMGYAAILAVLPFIGGLIATVLVAGLLGALFGGLVGGVSLVAMVVGGLLNGVASYIFNLATVFVVGLIINALAPSFDAKSDSIQAMKVAVYAGTALWVASLFIWIPLLGFPLLWIAALGYTCYLLYLGVAKLMQPPADKAVVYTLVVIGSEILLVFVSWFLVRFITGLAAIGAAVSGAPHL